MGWKLGDAFISIAADTSKLAGDFNFVRRTTDSFITTLNRSIMRIGIGSGLIGGLKLGADMEKLSVSMEVMTGSLAGSRKMIQDLRAFSRETPFSFESLAKSARLLLAYAIPAKDLIGTLRTLGNIAAGTGAQFDRLALAYGQVRSKGRLYAQEVRQFSEAGVSLLPMLVKEYGVTANAMSKMIEKGRIGFTDVERVLQKLTGETGRFSNIMRDLSTTSGAQYVKTLDDIKFLLQDIFTELAPLTAEVLLSTRAMLSYFTQLYDESSGGFEDFVLEHAAGLRTMRENWETAWDLMYRQMLVHVSKMITQLEHLKAFVLKLPEAFTKQAFKDSTLGYMAKNAQALVPFMSRTYKTSGALPGILGRALSTSVNSYINPFMRNISFMDALKKDFNTNVRLPFRRDMATLSKRWYANTMELENRGKQPPRSGIPKLWEEYLLSLDKPDPRTEGLQRSVDAAAERFGKMWSDTKIKMDAAQKARERRIREVDVLPPGELEPEEEKKKRKRREKTEARMFDIAGYGAAIQKQLFDSQASKLDEMVKVERDVLAEQKKVNDNWMAWTDEWRKKNERGPFDDFNRIEQAQRRQAAMRNVEATRNMAELRRFLNQYADTFKNIGDFIRRAGYLK